MARRRPLPPAPPAPPPASRPEEVCGRPLPLPPPAVQRRVRLLRPQDGPGAAGIAGLWGVAAEQPVEIGINGRPWTVMMASPSDLEDLALGLAWTEGLLRDPPAVAGIAIAVRDRGIAVDLRVDPAAVAPPPARSLEGRTGCGLCGLERLSELRLAAARPPAAASVPLAAVARAFAELPGLQPLNRATRSVHGAAFCAADGAIRLVREDVGRHNALDKLVGAMLRAGIDGGAGFIAMTSRCSFELVQKAARAGVSLLATVSAPTGMALEVAARAGLALACQAPEGALVVFEPGRLQEGEVEGGAGHGG